MNLDRRFLRTLDELDELLPFGNLAAYDEYKVERIALLLRQLLLEAAPLTDQVNRNRRIKIRYRVNDRPLPLSAVFWMTGRGFDPDTAAPNPERTRPREVTKDVLLSRPIMIANGHSITVRDLIRYVAHVEGAVHVGQPGDDKERMLSTALHPVLKHLPSNTVSMATGMLVPIGQVVRKGLQPLKERIEADLSTASEE